MRPQILYLHMRLMKPPGNTAVSYEQRYTVSSWASEDIIEMDTCEQGCTEQCDGDGQCVELAQRVVTDKIIQCPRHEA